MCADREIGLHLRLFVEPDVLAGMGDLTKSTGRKRGSLRPIGT